MKACRNSKTAGVSLAAGSGLACLAGSAALAWLRLPWAWGPAAAWIAACLAAPFLPRAGFFLPVISRGDPKLKAVALTFDDGPNPATTPLILDLLEAHGVPATFFVTGRLAQARPGLIRAIAARGHSLGNHSYSHDVLVSFKGYKQVYREVETTQQVLTGLGVRPLLFRPPVGVTYPSLGRALRELDLTAVTFSCRAGDRGNRNIENLAGRLLRKARAGDIVLLHDRAPAGGPPPERIIAEMDRFLKGLEARGLEIRPLAELIGRAVDLHLRG